MAKFEILERNDHTWYFYSEPIEILESEDINNISSNITTIKDLLLSNNLSVDTIKEVYAEKSTPFIEVFDILRNIEYNLSAINQNSVKSAYYVSDVKIGDTGSNREDIWRWIQVLNDLFDVLTLEKGTWGYLLLSDGYPLFDENLILIRGDLIG